MKRIMGLILILLLALTACDTGGQQSNGSFSIELSDGIEATLDQNNAQSRVSVGDEAGGYQIWFGRQEADLAVFFIFWGTDTIEADDYELFQGVPRDGVVVATVLENSDSIRSFAASGGTLTITQVGDTISGSFTMTLTDVTASENGEISVTGSFDNIPVSQ